MNRAEAIKYMAESPVVNCVCDSFNWYKFGVSGMLACLYYDNQHVSLLSGLSDGEYTIYKEPVNYLTKREIAKALLHGHVIKDTHGRKYYMDAFLRVFVWVSDGVWAESRLPEHQYVIADDKQTVGFLSKDE